MKNCEFAGYVLTEEEKDYLLQTLAEKRKIDERKRRVNFWKEHLISEMEQCLKEIGEDDTRRILRDLRTTVNEFSYQEK